MKIFLVTRENILGGLAAASRIRCLVKAFVNSGITCEVLLIKQSKGNGVESKGVFEGIEYRSMGVELSTKKTDVRRYIGYIHDDFALFNYLNRNLESDDIIFEYGSTIFHTHVILSIAHRKNAKFVRDLVEYPFGTQKETLFSKLQRKIMLVSQFRRYDGVVAISDALCNLAREYCRNTVSVIKVPILVEYDKYEIENKSFDCEENYIFHCGTLYEQKDGFVSMIKAFALYCQDKKNKPLSFISTGKIENSPHRDEIYSIIQEYSISDKVSFIGYVSNDVMKEYLQKASMVIINKNRNQQNTYCFSTKLAEYMAAGKAIVISRFGEAINWLTDRYDCFVVEPGNIEELVLAITELQNNVVMRKKIGENARKTCKRSFSHLIWATELKSFFMQL